MATQMTFRNVGKGICLLRANGNWYIAKAGLFGRGQIGTREVVGYGMNGSYHYNDRLDYPYPAIRFREIKGDLIKLKQKEKGDWKNLTKEEIKTLYRASFCRTFAEQTAPTGEWKSVLALSLGVISTALVSFVLMKRYVLDNTVSPSRTEEAKRKQLETYVKARVDPISGIGSLYDYEKDQWKEGIRKWYKFWW